MSRDWRVLTVPFIWVLLLLLGVVLVEGKHHQDGSQVVHRHRHRHESPSRWPHNYPRSWRDDEDYEDADDEAENDYDLEFHEKKSYPKSYSKGHRDRYDSRHTRPYYRSNHGGKFVDRRRKSHYGARERNHRIRPSRDRTYRKNSWEYDDEEDDYYDDYDKVNRYEDEDEFYPARRNFRRHRFDDYETGDPKEKSRRDWKLIRKDDRRDRRRKIAHRGVSWNKFHEETDDTVDDDFRTGKRNIFKGNDTLLEDDDDLDELLDDEDEEDDEEEDKWFEDDGKYSKDNRRYPKDNARSKSDGKYSKNNKFSETDRKHFRTDGKSYKTGSKYSETDSKYSQTDSKHSATDSKYSQTDSKYLHTDDKNSDTDEKYLKKYGNFFNIKNKYPKTNGKEYLEEEDFEDPDSKELDNDFYKNDVKPPLKTYDDIIRRLTSDDPTTPKSEFRRDYRNIEIGKYLKRDAFGNLKYDPKNFTKIDLNFVTISAIDTDTSTTTAKPTVENITSSDKKVDGEIKTKVVSEVVSDQVKNKSSDQDYDYGDNEQEDDPSAQTDGNNADYGEEDNDEDDESVSSTNLTTPTTPSTTTSTTTITTTTTTTTTTTPKPPDIRLYQKGLKSFERSTGAQYNGYQSKNEYPPMSAHSMHKWQSLGTRESVKETRDKYPEFRNSGKSADVNEALQHAIKVSREGSCQWPRARIVPVRDVYPSTSTAYIPHCAILHRCSDDTGCCRSEALTCVPKHSHRVELYFYTTNVEGGSVVEKLTFYNHTECECRERTELSLKSEKSSETRFARHHPPLSPQNLRRPPPKKPCRCPSEFIPKITPDGECQCKCSDTDQNCIRARRGKVFFSIRDRLCIQNGDCSTPICEFGEFMSRQGKCPRKEDQFRYYNKYHTNLHQGYRS